MRAIVYVRVSRVRGRKGPAFLSPTQQTEACEGWVRLKRGAIVARIEDLDVSGGTIERPGFQRALAMIEAGDADTLVVAKLDRFGRTIPGIYEAVARIENAGGHFASVTDGFDLTQPTGHLLLGMLAAFAEYDLRRLTAGWEDVHIRNVEAGIATRYPWGYKRGEDRRLVPTEEGRRYIPELFRRAPHESHKALALWLNAEGTRTKTGSPWTRATIAQLLENRAYLGEVRYGELFNPEAHEPLVDEATFHAAQRARGPRLTSTGPGLLTGLVRCAGCRFTLAHKPASPSRPYRVYRCERKAAHGCPAPVQVKADVLEAVVVDRVFKLAEEAAAGLVQEGGVPPEYAEALAELERLSEARTALDAVRSVLPDADAQLAAIDARIAELESGLVDVPEAEPVTPEGWEELTVEERRELLGVALDTVFVRSAGGPGKRAPVAPRTLVLARGEGPGPEELPRRGYSRVLPPFPVPEDGPAGARVAS